MTAETRPSAPPRWSARTPLKQRLRQREPLMGSFVFLPNASVVEILAEAGLDFVIIDQEHAPKSWETVEHMVRAAELYGMPALVRVHENTPHTLLHALEVGAAGVVVPFIRHADDVKAVVDAVRFPPQGKRGTCTQTRAARHSALRSQFVEHCQATNDELVIVGIIECPEGVRHIGSILDVPQGLDAVLLGRSDLAATMGRPGRVNDPDVARATHEVLDALRRSEPAVTSAMAVYGAAEVAQWREKGCSMFMAPSESSLLLDAAQRLRQGIVS